LCIGKPTPASHRNCVICCRPVSRLGRPYGRSAFPKGGIISSLPHGSGGCGRLALLFPIIFVAHHEAPYNEDILAHSVKKSSVSACITSAHSTYTRLCGQVYVQAFAGERDCKKDNFQCLKKDAYKTRPQKLSCIQPSLKIFERKISLTRRNKNIIIIKKLSNKERLLCTPDVQVAEPKSALNPL
jgi:hypothetical protein